jgi:PPOX class probable F420-dependent enzyme
MEIPQAIDFMRNNHHAVLHTFRQDGSPQLSPITVGVDGENHAIISSRETAVKTKNLARDPRAALCVLTDRFFGNWCFVSGTTEIVHLPEAMDLLVAYYREIAGEHPDWDDYRAAMQREQRVILRISVEYAGPNVSG